MKIGDIWVNPENFKPVKVGYLSKEAILNTDEGTLKTISDIDDMAQSIVDAYKSKRYKCNSFWVLPYVCEDKLYRETLITLMDVFGVVTKTKTFYAISKEDTDND